MANQSDECDDVKGDLDAALEAVREALTQMGVDPGDWELSVDGVRAASESLKQVIDGTMGPAEWGDAPDEGTLAGAIFKYIAHLPKRTLEINVELSIKGGDFPETVSLIGRTLAL